MIMIYPLAIIAVIILVFSQTINYGYTIDNFAVAKRTKEEGIQPKNVWQKIWWHLQESHYTDPKLAHFLTTLIHAINCLLIYFAFGRDLTAFLTALLFAIHPAGTQCSAWLSGKSYSLTTISVLLMYLFKWLAPVFYLFPISSSLNSIFAPAIFIFTKFWFWIFLIPFTGIFLTKNSTLIQAIKNKAKTATKFQRRLTPRKFIVYFKSLGYYFCLGLFPIRLGVYHTYLYSYGLSKKDNREGEAIDRFFWVGLAVMIILITNLIWNRTPAVFGLFWFVLFISQWCNLITIQQCIAERYLYLPMIGLMYFLAEMIMAVPNPSWRMVILTAFFVYYLTRLIMHIPSYKDLPTQVAYNLLNFPDNYAVYTWKGQVEKDNNQFFTALESWFNGWKLRKEDFRLTNNIAVMLTDLGRVEDASAFLDECENLIIPENEALWENQENARQHISHERHRVGIVREIQRKQELERRKNK